MVARDAEAQPLSRRSYAAGSIYRRKSDGRWCAAIFEGSRRRIVYGDTRHEVAAKLREVWARKEALFSVALALGLRQGEALGLRWQDVDLFKGTLRVSHQLQRVDGRLALVPPKTEKSRRTLVMPPLIIAVLREHQKRQEAEKTWAGSKWEENGLVFANRTGRPTQAKHAIELFHQALDAAGMRRIRFHDLRHSCATLLLVQGVSPRVVMEVLGHSEIALTMNAYSHVVPELRTEAAQRMQEILER